MAHARAAFDLSERRACAILGFDRTSVRYRSSRGEDAHLRGRLRALAGERRRFGWRRLLILPAREGIAPNHKKLRRVYSEERLQVRRRGGRKRALDTRAPMTLPQGPNQRWSLDFVSDALGDGRRFRVLAIVDDFTRECLALVADTSLSGVRVTRELDALVAVRGRPLLMVSDNGTELTSTAILRWCQERGVEWHYIAPGKPTQNAFQADPERLRGVVQRQAPGRMLERDPVPQPRPRTSRAERLAGRLQPRASARGSARAHARQGCRACARERRRAQHQPRTPAMTGGDQGLRSRANSLDDRHKKALHL